MASHEFRTPLTLIINPVKELLEKNSNEQKDKGGLNIIYRNARRMLSLVDQLLLFRKAESGLDKIKPSKLNLHDLACEVYLCFIQQAKTQRINYVFDCANRDLEIYADREKLEIILYNLLSNALKYTPAEGRIRFLIEEAAEHVEIKVEDNGAGIPSEIGEKLFDKFYKAERTKTSSKAGFGIGLFLVKHFTEQHGGAISYHSGEGQGTIFTLNLLKGKAHFPAGVIISETEAPPQLLEALREEAPLQETSEEKEPIPELISEKQSILIVDDDESIRQYLTRLFKETYIIYQAENGEAALAAVVKQRPDLILMDIQLPILDGYEATRRIKADPALSSIPIIAVTSYALSGDEEKARSAGCDDFVPKPYSPRQLLAKIRQYLP